MNQLTAFRNAEGELHRTDGPAQIFCWGTEKYFVDGQLHRTDGPAVDADNYKAYWVNGRLHNVDGPAIQHLDYPKRKAWFIKGTELTEAEFDKRVIILAELEN